MRIQGRESGDAQSLDDVLRHEEISGLWLATIVRSVALFVVAVAFFWLQDNEIKYVNISVLVLFAALGFAHYLIARKHGRQGWFSYLFLALDVALLTAVLLLLNPILHEDALPPAMMLRTGNFMFYYLFVALAALTYSSGLMIWTGFSSAAAWGIGTLYVASLPQTITLDKYPTPDDGWSNDAVFELLGNPNFLNPYLWQGEVVSVLVISGVLAVVAWRSRRLVVEQAVAAREKSNLSRYFPPNLVDQLAAEDKPLGAVRRQKVTVLFADIVGFTRQSETMDPEAVIDMLRTFHATLEHAVFEHGGTLDKFLGDGLMATFGTPEPGERDAANALKCARAMLSAIDKWNTERKENGEIPVRLSIGLHTGEAVLGDIGSERRMEFAVLGDVVNVASRIESLTRELNVSLLASDAVVTAVRRESAVSRALLEGLHRLPDQRLRGRTQPAKLWRLAA